MKGLISICVGALIGGVFPWLIFWASGAPMVRGDVMVGYVVITPISAFLGALLVFTMTDNL